MINLDLKDKRIISELDKNSRQTNTQIAKKVGLSKQVVGFRINRLIEKNLFSNFFTVIDTSKLGFTIHKNFLRLQNVTKEKEKKLLEYTQNNPEVVWAASCDGRYDFVISTRAENPEHLNKIIQEINAKFGSIIYERQTATIIRGQYLSRDYLLDKKRTGTDSKPSFGAIPETPKIDAIDWKILLELGKDARISAVDLSNKVGLSADSVGDRIKKLEKQGVVKGYTIVPNEGVYPYLHYKILVSLKNNSEEISGKLVSYCKSNSSIVYVVKSLGQWDFEIDCEVESVEKFRELMMDFKSQLQENMKDYSSLSIYKVHKYNFCPSIPK